MTAGLEPRELVTRLAAAGATFAVTPSGGLRVRSPVKGVLTPDVVEALKAHKAAVVNLAVWNQQAAEALFRETLARVAAQFRAEWAGRYRADGRWLEPQARIETAFLTCDMVALRGAVQQYEESALRWFAQYAAEDKG